MPSEQYTDTLQFLYSQRPAFERDGATGYKPGLDTISALCRALGDPHKQFPAIHIAGTNGKGSVAAMIAAALRNNGLRVGLFTSPHFVDFRERITVNREKISPEQVTDLVDQLRHVDTPTQATFFELTTALAFKHFANEKVDIAVVETGLGGRLDSTNIITPLLSVITNIGLDHTDLLGNTITDIAREKAGIIKAETPVVVGRADSEVQHVMAETARHLNAPITFADAQPEVIESNHEHNHLVINSASFGIFSCELSGDYQSENVNTALVVINILRKLGLNLREELVAWAFNHITGLTGLRGRWQTIAEAPRTIADSGHNPEAFARAMEQLTREYRRGEHSNLCLMLGFMADKDVDSMLDLLPGGARYVFTQAASARALPVNELLEKARARNLNGQACANAAEAYRLARQTAGTDGLVFIGGSMYVLAEVFTCLEEQSR